MSRVAVKVDYGKIRCRRSDSFTKKNRRNKRLEMKGISLDI